MKKMTLAIAGFILMVSFTACNGDSKSTTTTTTDSGSSVKSGDSSNAMNNNTSTMDNNTTSTTSTGATANRMPLSKDDSMFVMKAAVGGMLEVQSGTTAQQNGMNGRVKNFGTMLVNDHTKANNELMAIASARGIIPPAELPADKKKHLDDMAKMKGKSFDSHFISMMTTDHKQDIADFEKQANSGTDPELKAFAAKTLPVLKMHLDSVQALGKMKM